MKVDSLLDRRAVLLVLVHPLPISLVLIVLPAVTDLGEISLDPIPVRLLLCEPRPVLCLGLLLPENKDDRAGSGELLGLFRDDLGVQLEVKFVYTLRDTFRRASNSALAYVIF